MADAPSSGGSGWTAFEIIIVLLLGIALLDRLSGHPIIISAPTQTPTHPVPQTQSAYCGLNLIAPKAHTTIGAAFDLIGDVHGCNWMATQTTALLAQVVDANGVPVSDYISVPITTHTQTTAYFASVIALTRIPATTTGSIILVPAVPSSQHTQVTISVYFRH